MTGSISNTENSSNVNPIPNQQRVRAASDSAIADIASKVIGSQSRVTFGSDASVHIITAAASSGNSVLRSIADRIIADCNIRGVSVDLHSLMGELKALMGDTSGDSVPAGDVQAKLVHLGNCLGFMSEQVRCTPVSVRAQARNIINERDDMATIADAILNATSTADADAALDSLSGEQLLKLSQECMEWVDDIEGSEDANTSQQDLADNSEQKQKLMELTLKVEDRAPVKLANVAGVTHRLDSNPHAHAPQSPGVRLPLPQPAGGSSMLEGSPSADIVRKSILTNFITSMSPAMRTRFLQSMSPKDLMHMQDRLMESLGDTELLIRVTSDATSKKELQAQQTDLLGVRAEVLQEKMSGVARATADRSGGARVVRAFPGDHRSQIVMKERSDVIAALANLSDDDVMELLVDNEDLEDLATEVDEMIDALKDSRYNLLRDGNATAVKLAEEMIFKLQELSKHLGDAELFQLSKLAFGYSYVPPSGNTTAP